MLQAKTICISCGKPVYTELTGGYCLRCIKVRPDAREDAKRAQGATTLEIIEQSLRKTLGIHIPLVFDQLGSENIYGISLFTDPFYELITPCIFTETGLQLAAKRYQRESPYGADFPFDMIMRSLRWGAADSPYLGFRETDDFQALHLSLYDLWSAIPREDESTIDRTSLALEGICIAALRELRSSHLVPASLGLLLLQGDQGWEERFALAELLNPPEIVHRLREDWNPEERLVEQFRNIYARHR